MPSRELKPKNDESSEQHIGNGWPSFDSIKKKDIDDKFPTNNYSNRTLNIDSVVQEEIRNMRKKKEDNERVIQQLKEKTK